MWGAIFTNIVGPNLCIYSCLSHLDNHIIAATSMPQLINLGLTKLSLISLLFLPLAWPDLSETLCEKVMEINKSEAAKG